MIGLFSYLGERIEAGSMAKVAAISSNISATLFPFVSAGILIYILAYSYAIIRGEVQEPINRFLWDATKKAFILMFALNVGMYNTNIVSDVNMVTNKLTNAVNSAGSGDCVVATNDSMGIYAALDCSFSQFEAARADISEAGSKLIFSNANDIIDKAKRVLDVIVLLGFFIVSTVLVVLSSVVMYALIFVEVVVVRVILAMLFALGPLFIAALAFEPTKKYAEAWWSKLVYCVILQVIIVLFIGISVGIVSGFIVDTMNKLVNEPSFEELAATVIATSPLFAIALLTLAFVFMRLPGLAGELTGHSSASSGAIGAFAGGALGAGAGVRGILQKFAKQFGQKSGGQISGK